MDPSIDFNSEDWVDVPSENNQIAGLEQAQLDQDSFNSDDWVDVPKSEEDSLIKKAARSAGQFALGVSEAASFPYEIATAPLADKDAQTVAYRSLLSDNLEQLIDKKSTGDWDEQDEVLLKNIIDQLKDPSKSEEFIQTTDISLQGLAEKATGSDLSPQGAGEKISRWIGWAKNPKNLVNLAKSGVSKTELAKAVFPGKTEAFRGLAAGTALQAAEDGDMGPIGTLAVSIVADASAGGLVGLAKKGVKAVKSPKKTAADIAALFTRKDKLKFQESIIKDFNKAGIQADLGTITDSNIIRWTQSRLAQSGLTGKPLEKMRNEITSEIKNEYKSLADGIAKSRFSNNFEAGQATKDMIINARNSDLNEIREIYKNSSEILKDGATVSTSRLMNKITELEKSLTPGAIKSAEQKAVLKSIKDLKKDLHKVNNKGRAGFVEDLINNKRGIQDIINYEVQGGAKQLLKGVNAEIDRAIISHGADNQRFAKEYVKAQKRFLEHAKTFRNKNIDQVIRSQDPSRILDKMNSVQGIRDVKKALNSYPQGSTLFNDLKRYKLDQVIGNNMVDSVTQQAKLGTFSKLLEKGKNRELIKEILSPSDYKRLQNLQSNSGHLANSANKFFNSSQSATTTGDAVAIISLLTQVGYLLSGNPWPLAKGASSLVAAKKLSKLISDPEFLKLTEESIRAFNSKSPKKIQVSMNKLKPYALEFSKESKKSKDQSIE